uniref:SARAH domain-containing protein n=1 Tax=Strongyloides stercoralis TaxID=6248 RepID=A0AAF5DQB7_STRER
MNRNIKYRSVAYGTWHVGDARKFVEEKFNSNINFKSKDVKFQKLLSKDETITNKNDQNFLTLQISPDSDVLFKDELKSITPIMEVPINLKFLSSFDYYNQEDTLLTVSTTETDSLQFDSLKKRKQISINNQHSMADSGIADNSDSSPEGDWYSSTEYIQYCKKMQQTANTEDDFSFSSTISNTKKDDNNHCCSLETIYQNSVSSKLNNPITNKNISPTITFNDPYNKPLKVTSKLNTKNVPPYKLRSTMTEPCQIVSLKNAYFNCNNQSNNLNYYERNCIINSPLNNILCTNYCKPHCKTNTNTVVNNLPKKDSQYSTNCNIFPVLNDSLNNPQENLIISKENSKYCTNLPPYEDKNNLMYSYNSIDKRRAKSVEANVSHSVISNDQGYNTMRIKNLKNPLNTIMRKELKSNLFYDNSNNKCEFINNSKDRNSIIENCDNKKDKSFSAIKSTKNFFHRIFTNSTSTLPKKWKKSNDKNISKNEELINENWLNINSVNALKRYSTIHRTKTDTNYIINSTLYNDLLKKQYQSTIHINNHVHHFNNENIYKDLSIDKSLSQKSSSDSCYTSTISSNSPTYTINNKSIIEKLKEERLIKEKDYPSIEDFKNWNEIHNYLKNELEVIREKDYRKVDDQ